MKKKLGLLAGTAIAVAALSTPSYAALGLAGVAETSAGTVSKGVRGACTFAATLPSTSFSTIKIAYTATATATGAAISTSVRCSIESRADGTGTVWGSAGITLPGAVATIAGTADVPRLAPAVYGCVTASAAFVDGTVASAAKRCALL